MTRYNTPKQQKLIDDTRREMTQRIRDKVKKEEKERIKKGGLKG